MSSLFLVAAISISAKENKLKSESINKEHKKIAIEILNRYTSAKNISADLEKEDNKLTLGTKTLNKGSINYSLGKIYLKLESDKKNELYYKDNKIILVDYPDQDFDKNGPRKVTTISKDKPAFLQSLINLFSNSTKFFNEFKEKSSFLSNDTLVLNLEPNLSSLKNFILVLNTKDKTIESIQFTDDVNTQTKISFKNLDLKKKIAKTVFEFKSLKSDQEMRQ
ncbi:MAG: outer-membrane lipoprotein carrier protein LolA [Pseudobdellovibrio sp.]